MAASIPITTQNLLLSNLLATSVSGIFIHLSGQLSSLWPSDCAFLGTGFLPDFWQALFGFSGLCSSISFVGSFINIGASYRVFLGSSFILVCIYSPDSFIHLAEGNQMDAGDSRPVPSPEFWHTPNRLHEFPTWWIRISKLIGASEAHDGNKMLFFWRETGESPFGVPVGRWLVIRLAIYHPWFLFFPLILTAQFIWKFSIRPLQGSPFRWNFPDRKSVV